MGSTYTVGPSGSGADYIASGSNDQVPINQALAAAKNNPGSIVYLIGPFTYRIQDSLQMGSSTELTGDSTACLKVPDNAGWEHTVPIIKQSVSIISNVKIHGFEINANRWNQSEDEGDGYYNCISLGGGSTNHAKNIEIYNMYIHDSLGDCIRITNADNVIVHHNRLEVSGHEDVYFIEVVGGEIYQNTCIQKCNSAFRTDNSQNISIHHNTVNKYAGTGSNGNSQIQIGNQPSSYGRTRLTQNIQIYENTLNDSPASGIMLMDAYGAAGTTAQTVHIWNNTITGAGWKANYVKYNAGISVWAWGNGAVIEHNTITNSYNAGILVFAAIASGCTLQVNNNNITGTQNTQSTDPTRMLTVSGYGILNTVPTKMAVRAEMNYMVGNVSGDFYQVTPISQSTTINPEYDSGSSTGGTTTPATRYIPPIRMIQYDSETYYDPTQPKLGYINGVQFYWQQKSGDGGKSVGESKSPSVDGTNYTDFGFKGGSLVLDCLAFSMDELDEALAAFYDTSRGRSTLEIGGPYGGRMVTGLTIDHSTKIRYSDGDIPESGHPYTILFGADKHVFESVVKRTRGAKVFGSMQWSAANVLVGNLLKNPSFEEWLKNQQVLWDLETCSFANEFRCVRYSRELGQTCAVSAGTSDTTGTHIIISLDGGDSWAVPTGLTNAANYDNKWRGLAWGSSIGVSGGELLPGRWVATGISGSGNRSIYSDTGTGNWYAGGTTPSNSWGSCCYVRDDDVGIYRYVSVAYGNGETNRVMYTDNGAVSWTAVPSANESCLWISVCYSETLKRLVAVAFSGTSGQQAMYSDNFGATWNISATPTPNRSWTSVIWVEQLGLFVACAQDGGPQQIMTSPTGLSGSWTLQTTPICGSVVVPGTGTDVSTTTFQTPLDYFYATHDTTWDDGATPVWTIPALTNGHIWRLDSVACRMKTGASAGKTTFKLTAQTPTKAETTLVEWESVSTSYEPKYKDIIFESAPNEAVTIRGYMKTNDSDYKAVATDISYTYTEFDGSGGATISYTYNQYRGLAWSPENSLLICVAQTGTGNRVMMSTNAKNWMLGETPAADDNLLSACYAAPLNRFIVVGSGPTNRVMSSSSYGQITNPASWVVESPGQLRAESMMPGGLYSLLIEGDGVTEDIGMTKQYTTFEPGESYVVSAWATVTGLTAGKLAVDIFSGNSIVTQLLWDVDCERIQLQDTIRFDSAPADAFLRIHGIDTPNAGAKLYCDEVLIQKASEFETAASGKDIVTYGKVDVVPDIEVKAISSSDSTNVTVGDKKSYTDPYIHAQLRTSYWKDFEIVLPALANGKYYRFDQFSCQMATANISGLTAYAKFTLQCASYNGGVETQVAAWTAVSRNPTYTPKSTDTEIFSGTNEPVTIRLYIRSSSSSGKAYADDVSFAYTEMVPTVQSSAISIYNAADSLTVLDVCDELRPGCSVRINANGTGEFKYTENFADETYAFTVIDSSGITYDNERKMLLFASSGYMTFRFPTKFPITGIPYVVLNVAQGAPVMYIAADVNGSPGTWYPLDGNDTTNLSNVQAYRLLNSGTTLVLNGKTKFYLKITSGGSSELNINSIFMYAPIVTIDAMRPKIYKGMVNTFGALVASTASVTVSLEYRDAYILG